MSQIQTNEKKHNYFYKTTNLVNGKFYYGIYSTNSDVDYYFGSGTLILAAIKKYGIKNFVREIIEDYPTRKEASDHERLIVTEELIKNSLCYNLRTGGDNEFIYVHTEEQRLNISKSKVGKKRGEEFCKMMKEIMSGPRNPNIGRKHKPETKEKMSEWQIGIPKSEKTKELLSIAAKSPERIEISRNNLRNAPIGGARKLLAINGRFYIGIKSASEELNLSHGIIVRRLKSEEDIWKDWNYFKLEDYI